MPLGHRRRWRLAAGIAVVGTILIVGLQFAPFPGGAERFLATVSASSLVLAVLALWLLFFAGLRARTRIVLVISAIAVVTGISLATRVKGVSGDFVPQLTWKWSTPRDEQIANDLGKRRSKRLVPADLRTHSPIDSPQFLGPGRNGSASTSPLFTDWSVRPPVLKWRQPIGAGWSSFAVVGDYAVTQEQRRNLELVVCYAVKTGRVCWWHSDPGRFSSVIAGDGPRATPTIDEGRVYSFSALGVLNCLDGSTGRLLWTRDMVVEHRSAPVEWGRSCSPLVIDDLVVVSAGGPAGHSLVAYDKVKGNPRWQGGNDPSSYSSPLSATLSGKPQILIVNAGSVVAHDPTDGSVLWRHDWPGGMPKVSQPVPLPPDRVFLAAGYGLGCQMLRLETGKKGTIQVRSEWNNLNLKPKFTNVIVHGDCVYGLDDGRSLVCLDLATGKRRWRGGRFGHGQVLLAGKLLIIQAETGEVALVEASPDAFRELGRFQAIDGKTWNVPTLTGNRLLVRNAEEAACYELPLADDARKDAETR